MLGLVARLPINSSSLSKNLFSTIFFLFLSSKVFNLTNANSLSSIFGISLNPSIIASYSSQTPGFSLLVLPSSYLYIPLDFWNLYFYSVFYFFNFIFPKSPKIKAHKLSTCITYHLFHTFKGNTLWRHYSLFWRFFFVVFSKPIKKSRFLRAIFLFPLLYISS